jgi:hypothetical protein
VWIYTRPRNPSRLWMSQRDFLGRLASTVAGAPAAIVPTTTALLIPASGIEGRKVLLNCMGGFFSLRPDDWLIAKHSSLPYALDVSGSSAIIQPIVVNASSFSVTLASGSSFSASSPDAAQQFSSDITSDVTNNTCTGSLPSSA